MPIAEVLTEYEQERGKPMPSKNHAFVQHYLGIAFSRYDEQFTILPELSLEVGGRSFVPDLCIYPKLSIDWLHDDFSMT